MDSCSNPLCMCFNTLPLCMDFCYFALIQNVTFHDLVRNKARGKSGPLFNYDVHDDVRMQTDIRIEKDEVSDFK